MSLGHRIRVALRKSTVLAAGLLPTAQGVRIERYLRGREDSRLLGDCDLCVVSFGKSGRTWLMVLMSRFYQQRYGLPAQKLFDYDGLHRLNPKVPRVFFTHDNYLSDFTGISGSKSAYAEKRVVLLVRHPADTAVSQFFQWKHRMKQRKTIINKYPERGRDLTPYDFAMSDTAGIPKIVRFMNQWAEGLGIVKDILVVRYETLRHETAPALGRVLAFAGEEATAAELSECVRFASVENMRALERQTFFTGVGNRLTPGDPANPESYKVRRAKVGGYRDYFTDDEATAIDTLVAETLSPVFGYSGAAPDRRVI